MLGIHIYIYITQHSEADVICFLKQTSHVKSILPIRRQISHEARHSCYISRAGSNLATEICQADSTTSSMASLETPLRLRNEFGGAPLPRISDIPNGSLAIPIADPCCAPCEVKNHWSKMVQDGPRWSKYLNDSQSISPRKLTLHRGTETVCPSESVGELCCESCDDHR